MMIDRQVYFWWLKIITTVICLLMFYLNVRLFKDKINFTSQVHSPDDWQSALIQGYREVHTCQVGWVCGSETIQHYTVFVENTEFNEISKANPDLDKGGRWSPVNCHPPWRIALIVHIQGREKHLKVFLRNIIPFLKAQQVDFTIFAVEQVGDTIFNRAQAMDAGFVEAQNFGDFDCFIFHDVDMLPINLCNLYRCETHGVRHLGISRNLTTPKIVHKVGIGGAVALTRSQFTQINGFTTVFFGWGGEDDDGFYRVREENITLLRYHPKVGNYFHLQHDKYHNFPRVDREKEKKAHWQYRRYDGLNTLTYEVVNVTQTPLLTRIQIYIPGPKTTQEIKPYLLKKRKLFQEQLDRDLKKNVL